MQASSNRDVHGTVGRFLNENGMNTLYLKAFTPLTVNYMLKAGVGITENYKLLPVLMSVFVTNKTCNS
jgi:hypothetical protein